MSLKVLGIGGSPRRNGNTDRLLRHAMNTLEQAGCSTETLSIRDLNYSPCMGCNACSKIKRCVQKDDLQMLQERLIAADRIVIAAPIFFMGINAQMKAVIDRMQPLWALKYVFKEPLIQDATRPPRKGIYLSAAGTKFPDVFDCAVRSVKNLFHVLDVEYFGDCLYRGIDQAGDIEKHPTAFEDVAAKALELANYPDNRSN